MEFPKVESEEILRRRAIHIANEDSAMEGLSGPSPREKQIQATFVSGEYDDAGLMSALMQMVQNRKLQL